MSWRKPVCDSFQQHPSRKICKSCKNLREDHAVEEKNAEELLRSLDSVAHDASTSNNVYSWVPLECPDDRLDEYFKEFPEEKVPKKNSEGYKWRLKQILNQIPPSDVTESESRFVDEEYRNDYVEHIKNIQEHAVHIGHVKVWNQGMPPQCPTCLILLVENQLVVVPVEVSAQVFHPACFVCSVCNEQLVDLVNCFEADGNIYCERHFSETKKKRCYACDELIFTDIIAQAGKTYYHKDHLRCFNCDELPSDEKGYEKHGELWCGICYEKMFCKDCEKCKQRIHADSREVVHDDKSYHYSCFTCGICSEYIIHCKVHEGNIYCLSCYDQHFAPKCKACNKLFVNEARYVKYMGNTYHVECFKCAHCRHRIGESFVPHGDLVFCKGCHVREFGVRCYRCRLAITEDEGLVFDNKPYHKKCFTCDKCQNNLENEPFKPVENGVYCPGCYVETFCKTCKSCGTPIVLGANESSYSYEDSSWHAECFICDVCKISLVDKPFSIRGPTLFCKSCGEEEDDDTMRRFSKARKSQFEMLGQQTANSVSSQQDEVSPEAVERNTLEETASPSICTLILRNSQKPKSDSTKEPKEKSLPKDEHFAPKKPSDPKSDSTKEPKVKSLPKDEHDEPKKQSNPKSGSTKERKEK